MPGSPSLRKFQLILALLRTRNTPAGMWIQMSRSGGPASSSTTLRAVLGQPARHDATGRAGADDDVIRFHVRSPAAAAADCYTTERMQDTRHRLIDRVVSANAGRHSSVRRLIVIPAFAGAIISRPLPQQAADGGFGVGGAHDFAHHGDAARAGVEAGGGVGRRDAGERDDRARRRAAAAASPSSPSAGP